MAGVVFPLLLCILVNLVYGSCKVLSGEENKERAHRAYVKALKAYENNDLKEAYRLLKEALSIYDTREEKIGILHECYKLIPGAFMPVRKKYRKSVKKDYRVYELMRKIKKVLYPKLVVIVRVSRDHVRVSVYNLGKEKDSLPADQVKVIVEGFAGKEERLLGDIEPGKRQEVTIEGTYSTVRIEEKFGFNPFPVYLEADTEDPWASR